MRFETNGGNYYYQWYPWKLLGVWLSWTFSSCVGLMWSVLWGTLSFYTYSYQHPSTHHPPDYGKSCSGEKWSNDSCYSHCINAGHDQLQVDHMQSLTQEQLRREAEWPPSKIHGKYCNTGWCRSVDVEKNCQWKRYCTWKLPLQLLDNKIAQMEVIREIIRKGSTEAQIIVGRTPRERTEAQIIVGRTPRERRWMNNMRFQRASKWTRVSCSCLCLLQRNLQQRALERITTSFGINMKHLSCRVWRTRFWCLLCRVWRFRCLLCRVWRFRCRLCQVWRFLCVWRFMCLLHKAWRLFCLLCQVWRFLCLLLLRTELRIRLSDIYRKHYVQ